MWLFLLFSVYEAVTSHDENDDLLLITFTAADGIYIPKNRCVWEVYSNRRILFISC